MAIDRGILLVAHGPRSYWDEAATLARSLRHHSPHIPIAIASDLNVAEAQWRRDGYDLYVPYDFHGCGGVSFKMHLDRITPFSQATLFIDSDSICYRDISDVFTAFGDRDFVALGTTLSSCHWFEDTSLIHHEFQCHSFPFFCGDFYLFRKSPKTAALFDTAREIAGRFRKLGIKPIGEWCNDEPALSLAMATHGIPISEGAGDWIMQAVSPGISEISLNYARGTAICTVKGAQVFPRLVHFGAHRSLPPYFRERYRVLHPSPHALNSAVAHVVGGVQSVAFRAKRRIMKLRAYRAASGRSTR